MAHAPAVLGSFSCWRADAGLLPNRLRPASCQRVTERALLRLVLKRGGGHKMILPGLVALSHRKVIGTLSWWSPPHLDRTERTGAASVTRKRWSLLWMIRNRS